MSDLGEEIVKTGKHEVRVALHAEQGVLERLVAKLGGEGVSA